MRNLNSITVVKFFSLLFLSLLLFDDFYAQTPVQGNLKIKKTKDFEISGTGRSSNWLQANWIEISSLSSDEELKTRIKILYSDTGLYFLTESEDEFLTATLEQDFMELWNEDVVEVFLWPDESTPLYFEYEISPLNYELPLLVSNREGDLLLWQPYPYTYEENKRTRHKTSVRGGQKVSGSSISQWTSEFFIPYELLRPMNKVPPKPGTQWRANFCRIDYDHGGAGWSWQQNDGNFHDYEKFGTIVFE